MLLPELLGVGSEIGFQLVGADGHRYRSGGVGSHFVGVVNKSHRVVVDIEVVYVRHFVHQQHRRYVLVAEHLIPHSLFDLLDVCAS